MQMQQDDRDRTTLQTISTATEFALNIAKYVMGERSTDNYFTQQGRSVLADNFRTNLQNEFRDITIGAANVSR